MFISNIHIIVVWRKRHRRLSEIHGPPVLNNIVAFVALSFHMLVICLHNSGEELVACILHFCVLHICITTRLFHSFDIIRKLLDIRSFSTYSHTFFCYETFVTNVFEKCDRVELLFLETEWDITRQRRERKNIWIRNISFKLRMLIFLHEWIHHIELIRITISNEWCSIWKTWAKKDEEICSPCIVEASGKYFFTGI